MRNGISCPEGCCSHPLASLHAGGAIMSFVLKPAQVEIHDKKQIIHSLRKALQESQVSFFLWLPLFLRGT